MTHYLGVDIGGTKIAVGVVNQDGTLLAQAETPTPQTGAAAVLDATAALCYEHLAAYSALACGVGMAGQINPKTGQVVFSNSNIHGWAGAHVRDHLAAALDLPVYVDNDVNAMVYSETTLGVVQAFEHIVYVTVGTGIGGAIVTNGTIWHGAHYAAGEIGYLYAGDGHTIEQLAAGPGIARAYNAQATPAKPLTLPEIADRAHNGDPLARSLIQERSRLLGEVIAPFLYAVDPQVLIVGGGVPQIGPLWWEPFTAAVRHVPGRPITQMEIRPAALNVHAVMVGAAMMAKQQRTEQAS